MDIVKIIISGFAIGFVSALPLGPSALEIIRRGVLYGFREAFGVALGTATSDIIYSTLALAGVSAVILSNRFAENVIGVIAAIIIASFGLYTIYDTRKNNRLSLEKLEQREPNPYATGLLMTVFNPFVLLFWSGVVALVFRSSLVSSDHFRAGIFIASAIFGILVWTLILSYLASIGKVKFGQHFRRNLNLIIGLILILAALLILIKLFLL